MQIVELQPQDWQKYRDFRIKMLEVDGQFYGDYVEEAKKKADKVWIERLEKSLTRDGQYILFAEQDGVIIGSIGTYWLKDRPRGKHIAKVVGLFVEKEHRRNGIASQLMQKLHDELPNFGIKKTHLYVVTTNKRAIKLYESLGYRRIGTYYDEIEWNGEFLNEFAYEKIF